MNYGEYFYVKLRYGINLRTTLRKGRRFVAARSRKGPWLVADQSPTSFNDSHGPL